MNFGMAVAPWLFGILADKTDTNLAIGIGIGVSCLAAAINFPLTRDARFGRVKELSHSSKRVLTGEDLEFVEKALAGELVDQEEVVVCNLNRLKNGKSVIIPRVKPYNEDKESGFDEIHATANESYKSRVRVLDRTLAALGDPNNEHTTPEELCKFINIASSAGSEYGHEAAEDLGNWVGEYLEDVGYNPHTQSVNLKHMIMTALPPISHDKEYIAENLETNLLRSRNIHERYAQLDENEERKKWSYANALGTRSAAVFYS